MPAEQRTLLSMMSHAFSVRNWSELFETGESRKRPGALEWVKMRTKHDGRSFRRVARLRNGQSVLLGWYLLLQVAAKMPCRGVLADLDGPLDARDLADKTGFSEALFRAALMELIKPDIGWIEKIEWQSASHFWDNIERLERTPAYKERQEKDAERKRQTRADTGGHQKEPLPRAASNNGQTHADAGAGGTTREDNGGHGLHNSTTPSTEEERQSPLPQLSRRGAQSLLIALSKKSFAGAELSEADFRNPEKERCLVEAMPITSEGWTALEWFYTLPMNHEVFKTTARVQSAEQLLRKLKNEVGKALTMWREFQPVPRSRRPAEPDPEGWRELYEAEYPGIELPATFWQLTKTKQQELETLRAKHGGVS